MGAVGEQELASSPAASSGSDTVSLLSEESDEEIILIQSESFWPLDIRPAGAGFLENAGWNYFVFTKTLV